MTLKWSKTFMWPMISEQQTKKLTVIGVPSRKALADSEEIACESLFSIMEDGSIRIYSIEGAASVTREPARLERYKQWSHALPVTNPNLTGPMNANDVGNLDCALDRAIALRFEKEISNRRSQILSCETLTRHERWQRYCNFLCGLELVDKNEKAKAANARLAKAEKARSNRTQEIIDRLAAAERQKNPKLSDNAVAGKILESVNAERKGLAPIGQSAIAERIRGTRKPKSLTSE